MKFQIRLLTVLSTFALLFASAVPRAGHADGESGVRTIYCGGVRGAVGFSYLRALCFDFGHRRAYSVKLMGLGLSLIVSSTAFKLSVNFPAGRYDADFDPIPGEYFASVKGFSPGYSQLNGSAGNKTLIAHAINAGAGVDRTLGAYLKIKRTSFAEAWAALTPR